MSISRPTPSFVLALVALVFAMAGTGYAAATINGKSVKKRSLPANRVKTNSLSTTQIDESRLDPVPAAQTALTADTAKTADTATSAQTAESAQTAAKAADADKLGGKDPSAYVHSDTTLRIKLVANVAVNNGAEGSADCLPGEVALSGGGAWYIAGTDTTIGSATLSTSAPILDAQGKFTSWRAEGKNTSTAARDFRAWVVCAA
jgi:hypothetical protein